jgi:hypothetical protein
MADKPQPYYGTWINRQRSLLPGLDEELDPLTDKLEHLIVILDTLGLEACSATIRVNAALPRLKCSRGLTRCLIQHAPDRYASAGGGDGADQHGDTG